MSSVFCVPFKWNQSGKLPSSKLHGWKNPSSVKSCAGAAIIAYGFTAFSLGVKYLRVVDHSLLETEHEKVNVEVTKPVTI